MSGLFSIITLLVCLLLPSHVQTTYDNNNNVTNEALNWAEVTASRLVTCYYDERSGKWKNELAWQSGNTLESLANFMTLLDSPLKYVFYLTYLKTDMYVGGDCFDDWQWWLLAWVQAYSADPNIKYLQRAADAHDVVTSRAWNTSTCSGGIKWCPTSTYKNAITNELFLASSMRLHPYAALLGKPSNYYLDWALKEWQWFENSGIINNQYLINDGLKYVFLYYVRDVMFLYFSSLPDNTCVNNKQTTWTYNQGVVLSGLALLYNATGNSTLLTIAQNIADATIQHLTYSNGILKEPCEPNCDNDQKLFKGIFTRHLSYLLPYLTDPSHIQNYTSFLQQNARSLWTTDRCETDGLFGLFWTNYTSNTCDPSRDTSTTSSALDLFVSVAKNAQPAPSSKWMLLGLGNCADDNNASMPNFYSGRVSETVCQQAAEDDAGAVAYDYQLKCNGDRFCRIRTLSDQGKTPAGFEYGGGSARTVTRTNKMVLTNCYLKIN